MSLSAVERSQCCKHASFAQSAAHMIVRTLLLWVLISCTVKYVVVWRWPLRLVFGLSLVFFRPTLYLCSVGYEFTPAGVELPTYPGPLCGVSAAELPTYLPCITAAKTWRAKFGRTRRGCVAVGTRPLLRFPANDFCEFEQMSSKIKLVVGMPDEDMGTFLQDVFGAELGDFKASSLFATGSSLLLFIPALLPRCEAAPNYLPTSSCRTVGRRPTYLPPWVRYRLSL